jgi:hypothetical protein
LINGKDFDKVQSKVVKVLENKLVIVLDGEQDFASLGIPIGDYEHFDLQQHWFKEKENVDKVLVREKLGLRALCYEYFKVDIQKGHHSSLIDAKYTMKLFADIYTKIKINNIESKINFTENYDDIKSAKELEELFK